MAKVARTVPVVNVKSRHRSNCKHKGDGNRTRCDCPKQLVWSHNGEEHRVSADTCDYEVAEGKARDMENSFARAANQQPQQEKRPEQRTLEGAVTSYLAAKRTEGVGERHMLTLTKTFQKDLLTYCNSHALVCVRDIELSDLEHYRGTWKLRKTTAQKEQSRIVGFFAYCLSHGWVDRNVAEGLGTIRIREGDVEPTIALNDAQFTQLLGAIPKIECKMTEEQRKTFRALILVQRWAGFAIKDAVKLERNRIEPDPEREGWRRIFIRRAKTGVAVYATLAPELAAEILGVENPENPRFLFTSGADDLRLRRAVQKWTAMYAKLHEVAKLKSEHGEPLWFHSQTLRDSYAVWLLEQGLPTEDVSALLGHSSIAVTEKHYLPWIESRARRLVTRVKAAYDRWQEETKNVAVPTPENVLPLNGRVRKRQQVLRAA